MPFMTRTVVVQARLRPEIKYASELVLQRIGLTMTEAMELFLRRIIVDEKLPFEVAALDNATLASIFSAWKTENADKQPVINIGTPRSKAQKPQKRE